MYPPSSSLWYQGLPTSGDVPTARVDMNSESGGCPNLFRQSSPPIEFLTLSKSKTSPSNGTGSHRSRLSRLNPQRSFLSSIDNRSRISDETDDHITGRNETRYDCQKTTLSYVNVNEVMFSGPPTKRVKKMNGGVIFQCLDTVETQIHFGLPDTEQPALGNIELEIPQNPVPYKIRAKRGCATQPRSIAERERRMRISQKLKKIQDLVPKVDKQTSYADMLDLAVQHISDLQHQVQKLIEKLDNCTCRRKKIK